MIRFMQPQRNRMGWAEVIAGSKQLGSVTVKYTDGIPKPYSPETVGISIAVVLGSTSLGGNVTKTRPRYIPRLSIATMTGYPATLM